MAFGYSVNAAKRPVNLSLNEDLVAQARKFTGNPSEQVERLLAEFVAGEQKRRLHEEGALQEAVRHWNACDERHGAFADEYIDL